GGGGDPSAARTTRDRGCPREGQGQQDGRGGRARDHPDAALYEAEAVRALSVTASSSAPQTLATTVVRRATVIGAEAAATVEPISSKAGERTPTRWARSAMSQIGRASCRGGGGT